MSTSASRSVSEGSAQQPIDLDQPTASASKRKRVSGSVSESPVPESLQPVTLESTAMKIEEIDSLVAPVPTPQHVQALQQFAKRSKAQQAKFPAIKGLPNLACDSTIKLPAPKSYDKLAPLVALPPRSKRPIVPELGYDLPCEVQGRFTIQYQPAFNKIGLDERRIEAKSSLDEFDRSMKALGKRRPKYTEYPHAFKEQLKSDEASKNKAAKTAKKDLGENGSKSTRPATRPMDPKEAAAWDVIGIVTIEPASSKTSALVAQRVQQAGELFISLRGDMNQAKQLLDHATKENQADAKIAELKKEAELKKDVLYRAFDATIEHADDSVMDNLAGHQKLILSLVNVLISSIKAGDFSGKLPKIVLELFTHFPMSKKIAETTNFDTVRKRFADKGDDEVKDFVREISAKLRKLEGSTGYAGTSAASRAKATTKAASGGASAKRGRDDDATEPRIVKKVAVEPGSSSLMRKLGQPKLQLQSASKTTAAKAAASSIQLDKTRPVAKPAPKTDSGGNSPIVSADDKSRTEVKKAVSKLDASKVTPKETKQPAPKNGGASTLSALSGIGSLLASISAPKPELVPTPKKSEEVETNETPEEKAKRLRKESRRSLRVSWRPEGELVQIRIFEKEESEDEGRDINMIRDAADDRAEGMMLKQGMDMDDEDDDDIPYQPWEAPATTDFSSLSEDARKKNYTTRGGTVSFTTNEQTRIAQREQRELMAIYADLADMPPTPKSPPPEDPAQLAPRIGYLPQDTKFEEMHQRWREEAVMGPDGALYNAIQRLNAKASPSNKLDSILGNLARAQSQSQPSPSSATRSSHADSDTNVPLIMGAAIAEQVIAWLKSEQTKRWIDPAPSMSDPSRAYNYSSPGVQVLGRFIESLAQGLSGKPFPATSPPDWLAKDEERLREWWLGYNKEAAARLRRAEDERVRAEAQAHALQAAVASAGQGQNAAQDWNISYAQHAQQQQTQQQQAYAPYMAILQQMGGAQTTGAQAQPPQAGDAQLQALIATLGQPQQQAPVQPPNAASFMGLNPNDPSFQQYMMLQQIASGQQPQPSTSNEPDRDRNWDRHDRDDYRDHRGKKVEKKKPGPSSIHKPPNAALIGTKPCTFWQQGKCARGDKCTFRHD